MAILFLLWFCRCEAMAAPLVSFSMRLVSGQAAFWRLTTQSVLLLGSQPLTRGVLRSLGAGQAAPTDLFFSRSTCANDSGKREVTGSEEIQVLLSDFTPHLGAAKSISCMRRHASRIWLVIADSQPLVTKGTLSISFVKSQLRESASSAPLPSLAQSCSLSRVACITETHALSATQAKKPTARKASKCSTASSLVRARGPATGRAQCSRSEAVLEWLSHRLRRRRRGRRVDALGVAMFSLSAPTGELKNFTAVVPVVNCCANVGTVLQYSKHANRSICMKMWPFIVLGICVGTWLLPRIDEASLRKFTSVVYALVLAAERLGVFPAEAAGEERARRRTTP